MQIHFQAPSIEELDALFNQYKIESFIAQGGMGAVYLATQTSLDRKVAIKILPDEFGEDESYHESFSTEAKAMAKVSHGNLVAVYDFGKKGQMLYIVMEYIPGQTLFDIAHGQKVDIEEAASLIIDICNGLGTAHSANLIHRDIKPANILVNEKGEPKLVDFGLATLESENEYDGGLIYGTPGYTAPEVLKTPGNIDHKVDIFSVGVMFFELLTGELPNTQSYQHPSTHSPKNAIFDAIILKAVQPSPQLRFSSAEEMAEAINAALKDVGKTHIPAAAATIASIATPLTPVMLGSNEGSTSKAPHKAAIPARPSFQQPQLKSAEKGSSGLIYVILGLVGIIGLVAVVSLNKSTPPDTETASPFSSTEENLTNTDAPAADELAHPESESQSPEDSPLAQAEATEVVQPTDERPDRSKLAHHYTFDKGSKDNIGKTNLALKGPKVRKGKLILTGNYNAFIPGNVYKKVKDFFSIELWLTPHKQQSPEASFVFSVGSSETAKNSNGFIDYSPNQQSSTTLEAIKPMPDGRHQWRAGETNSALPLNELTHLVVTFNKKNNNIQVFENGKRVIQITSSFSLRTLNPKSILIGRSHKLSQPCFKGTIDDIKIYNSYLSPTEILALFQHGIN